MTLHISRTRRAIAASAGLATAAALALLPGTATAAPAGPAASGPKAGQTAGPELSYIVNVRPGQGNSARVKRAVAQAGGSVLQAYDRIGVLVVHSANADFAKTIRTVRGSIRRGRRGPRRCPHSPPPMWARRRTSPPSN